MNKINIFHLHNGYQFSDDIIQSQRNAGWLGREPLPFDVLLQLNSNTINTYDKEKYQINVINNADVTQCSTDAITLVPFDFQSFPITFEHRNGYQVSDFGKQIDQAIQHIVSLNLPNLMILLYTSTEPYFFDANIYLAELGVKYPHIKILVSGSGETRDHHGNYKKYFLKTANLHKVSKLWYFDRVQYFTSVSDNPKLNKIHIDLSNTTIPSRAKDWISKNRFLLTMRNCRTHRLLFGAMWENSKMRLGDTTYGRFYSLLSNPLNDIANKTSYNEFKYHIELMTTALHDIQTDSSVPDYYKNLCTRSLVGPPHYIDMTDLEDRGIPGPWLYNLCDFVIAPAGEAYGYGYVDEKQMIPMYFKKPFLTFGCKGLYEEMKKIDFKVFDDCWPVSFNESDTLYDRVYGAYQVLEYMRKLDEPEWQMYLEKTKQSVDYNYESITTGGFRLPSNNNFFEEVVNYASS